MVYNIEYMIFKTFQGPITRGIPRNHGFKDPYVYRDPYYYLSNTVPKL